MRRCGPRVPCQSGCRQLLREAPGTLPSMCVGPLCLGHILVDEAVSLAKSLCSATPQAICFVLLPQFHASADREVIVKHRRQLEDLLLAFLD